jgi:hypothetical protein
MPVLVFMESKTMKILLFAIAIICMLWCLWMIHFTVAMAFPANVILTMLWAAFAVWNGHRAWVERPRKAKE